MSDTSHPIDTQELQPGVRRDFSRVRALVFSVPLALIAGLAASLSAAFVMGLLRALLGIPAPIELFGSFVLKHISVDTFIRLLIVYHFGTKTIPLGIALWSMIVLGTILGLLYALLVTVRLPLLGYRPQRREWLVALIFAFSMTFIAVILFWNELPQNHFGLSFDWSRVVTILGLVFDFTTYALVLCFAFRALLPKVRQRGNDRIVAQRRALLARGGVAVVMLGTGIGLYVTIQSFLRNYASYDGMKTAFKNMIIPVVTPNNDHYIVTQNAIDPVVNSSLWQLEVTGLVERPGTYNYEELQMLPATTRAITLECIANGLGDHLIGNAIWHGVTLRTLLEKHGGAQSAARYVAFYSVDGYNVSLPLNEVLDADALLAWQMNGVALPTRHGYPLRVLIPGRYGEENPKWLTRVALTDHFVQGLYSSQGWYNGPVHTISRIDNPVNKSTVPVGQPVEVRGIAYSGTRGIQRVEISADGGVTWKQARLDAPLSKDSWVFWQWQWQPVVRGPYQLTVRATDGTGTVQTSRKQGTVPGGATGYHQIMINAG